MNIKKLSIIIALKRRNKNSCFRKKANHIIAGEFGISAYLFSKLVKELVSDGYIVEQGNYYRIVRFKTIIRDFFIENDLYVGSFDLLLEKSLKYHEILNSLYDQLIYTNAYNKQQCLIQAKKDLLSSNSRTALKSYKFFRKRMFDYRCVDEITASIDEKIRVSARLIAKTLKVSLAKANELLNNSKMFAREVVFKIVKTIRKGKLEFLQAKYPNATIIPFFERNEYKICFGSEIRLIKNIEI